jgi:hypothetical protein
MKYCCSMQMLQELKGRKSLGRESVHANYNLYSYTRLGSNYTLSSAACVVQFFDMIHAVV